jgi:hypothetical protein
LILWLSSPPSEIITSDSLGKSDLSNIFPKFKKDIKHRDKKAIVSTNLSNDDL